MSPYFKLLAVSTHLRENKTVTFFSQIYAGREPICKQSHHSWTSRSIMGTSVFTQITWRCRKWVHFCRSSVRTIPAIFDNKTWSGAGETGHNLTSIASQFAMYLDANCDRKISLCHNTLLYVATHFWFVWQKVWINIFTVNYALVKPLNM